MKLTALELAYVRAQGLYVTERCDGCGKLLNQTARYMIAGRREIYCSAVCRDLVYFSDRHEAEKRATPGKCLYCRGGLNDKKRGALYCDDVCRMRHSRNRKRTGTRQVERSRTPTQSNQALGDAKTIEQGNGINNRPQPLKTGRCKVSAGSRLPVEVGQITEVAKSVDSLTVQVDFG
jgi:hypothetical protein